MRQCKKCGEAMSLYGGLIECAPCRRLRSAAYKAKNRELCLLRAAQWRASNKPRVQQKNATYKQKHAEAVQAASRTYYAQNREAILARNAEWRRRNPDIVAANRRSRRAEHAAEVGRRNAAILQRTPAWGDVGDVAQFYQVAAVLSRGGVKFHVDHEVPLRGKTVSGLHVPANLRVIPWYENLRKGNRF